MTKLRARLPASVLVAAVLAFAPSASASDQASARNGFDQERGVFSFGPALSRIMPAVVQVLVSVESGGDRAAPAPRGDGRRFGDPYGERPPRGDRGGPRRGSGSGVIVDAADGLVMTNHHVIAKADGIKVRLRDGRSYDARVVGSDDATDIALLQIDARGDSLDQADFADSEALQVGDLVIALGYPFGLKQTATMGIVSGLGRTGIGKAYEDFIQTDAAINRGNSGGPLVDSTGRVVGINTAIYSRTGVNIGIGFAVPTRIATAVMDQLKAHGEVRRGRLGVVVQDLTPDLAEALDLDVDKGALVSRVTEDSPGSKAGIESGDVIVEANDQIVETASDLRNVVGLAGTDATISLTLLRGDETRTVEVAIESGGAGDGGGAFTFMGASFGPLPEDHPAAEHEDGSIVTAIEPDSVLARKGLRPGDIVVSVNKSPVPSVADLERRLTADNKVKALTVLRGNNQLLVVVQDSRKG